MSDREPRSTLLAALNGYKVGTAEAWAVLVEWQAKDDRLAESERVRRQLAEAVRDGFLTGDPRPSVEALAASAALDKETTGG